MQSQVINQRSREANLALLNPVYRERLAGASDRMVGIAINSLMAHSLRLDGGIGGRSPRHDEVISIISGAASRVAARR